MKVFVSIAAILLASHVGFAFAASESEVLAKVKEAKLICGSNPKIQRVDIAAPADTFYIVTCATGKNEGVSSILLSEDDAGGPRVLSLAVPVWNEKAKVVGFTTGTIVPELIYESDTQDFVSAVKPSKTAKQPSTSSATYHVIDGAVVCASGIWRARALLALYSSRRKTQKLTE